MHVSRYQCFGVFVAAGRRRSSWQGCRKLNSHRLVTVRPSRQRLSGPRIIASRESILRIAWAIVGLLLAAPAALADIQLPVPDVLAPVRIDGQEAVRWQQGAVEVWVVRNCEIQQDLLRARADEAVLWVDRVAPTGMAPTGMAPTGMAPTGTGESHITVYLEGAVSVDFVREGQANPGTGVPAQSIRDHTWFGRLNTRSSIDIRVPVRSEALGGKPSVYHRGEQAWDQAAGRVQLAQFTTESPAEPLAQPPLAPFTGTEKRVHVGPRSNTLIHIKSFPGSLPNQSVTVFSNGIRAVIEGLEAPQLRQSGTHRD